MLQIHQLISKDLGLKLFFFFFWLAEEGEKGWDGGGGPSLPWGHLKSNGPN